MCEKRYSRSKPDEPRPWHFYLPVKTEDDEPIKCDSATQSPTKSPETVVEQSVNDNCKAQPLHLPAQQLKKQLEQNETLDANSLSGCDSGTTSWNALSRELKLRGAPEAEIIKVKAEQLDKAIQVYICLMSECGGALRQHIDELRSIANKLNKVSMETNVTGITEETTAAAGGAPAVIRMILSPFALVASLVSVASASGFSEASTAITNKVNITQDKKKINKTLQHYMHLSDGIQACLKFINKGMEQLKQHDLSALSKATVDSVRAAKVVELAAAAGASAVAFEGNSKASALIEEFVRSMNCYFTQGVDEQRVKSGLESKFAKKICKLAEDLNKEVNELMKIKDWLSEHC